MRAASEGRFQQALARSVRCFQAARVPYAVIGALALAVWGRPRATLDLDFLVLVDAEDLDRLGARMARAGMEVDETWLEWNPTLRGSMLRLHDQGVAVDLLRPRDPHDRHAFGRRVKKRMEGRVYWFTTDFRLASGQTPLELFLQREGPRLRSGELRYLERSRLTHLRPYEVVGVTLDEGFDLLDLWARKRIRVRERLATRKVVPWDVLAARVMLGPAGVPVIDGLPYLYPARAKDAIVKELKGLHRRFRRRGPGDDVDFFKRFGWIFFLWWIEYVVLASRLAFHRATSFESVDRPG